ncbi:MULTISPECIES: GIY-YIG nuclease family protein [Vibrio]|uniref:GIY-YIG nuclease family protein n=1 Tax=Vibrio TaxID=662 RepID=UPI001CC33F02|nr:MULTISPECIES: GIY-YIG nuclease family protein [Vibrio]
MDDAEFLDAILKADKYGWISEPKDKVISVKSTEFDTFSTINDFFREHGRPPEESGDMVEFKLYHQLQKLKDQPALCDELSEHDEFNLLSQKTNFEDFDSFDDILNSDLLERLSPSDSVSNDIFSIKNVTKPEVIKERKKADQIGKTLPCPNFDTFKPLFENVHYGISSGLKGLETVSESELSVFEFKEGNFYLLKGMLLFIDYMSDIFRGTDREDRRLLIIFENGTQSTMLLRSLTKRIREDLGAKRVTNSDGTAFNAKRIKSEEELDPNLQVYKKTKATGYIYIAKTLREDLRSEYRHLYKIGLTKRDVKERFKEAPNDPAFLMSPAEEVKIIPLKGLDLNSVEAAIHSLFDTVRLEIEVIGNDGRSYKAKEWFIVPITAIEETVSLIQDLTIHMYRYDSETQQLIMR